MRFWMLDPLRWALASYVFFYHSAQIYGWGSTSRGILLDTGLRYGYLSVYIFFIISGIAIYVSTSESPFATDFINHRVKRLLPGLIFAAVIGGVTAAFMRLYGIWGESYSEILIQVFMNLLPNPDIHGNFRDGVVWSLAVEIQFYLYVTFLLLLVNITRQRKMKLSSAWKNFIFTWLALIYLADYLKIDSLDSIVMTKYAPFFILGLLIALKLDAKLNWTETSVLCLTTVPPLISKIQLLSHEADLNHFQMNSEKLLGISVQNFGILTFLILLVVLLGSLIPKNKLENRNFQKITSTFGRASYVFYLLGGFFGHSLVNIFKTTFPEITAVGLSYLIVGTISLMFSSKAEPIVLNYLRTRINN